MHVYVPAATMSVAGPVVSTTYGSVNRHVISVPLVVFSARISINKECFNGLAVYVVFFSVYEYIFFLDSALVDDSKVLCTKHKY